MKRFTTKRMVQIAVMAAILCVVSPFTIPLTAGVPLKMVLVCILSPLLHKALEKSNRVTA